VLHITPGSVIIGAVFSVVMNGKTVSYTAAAATVADVVNGLVAAMNATTAPAEFREVLWAANAAVSCIIGTALTPGVPFTVSSTSATLSSTLTNSATLAVPVNSTFTDVGTGGSLAFNTHYYYKITAYNAVGETTASAETNQVTANDAANTHKMTLTWSQVPGATGYKIYGRSTGAELFIAGVVGETTLTYTDDGSITPAGALPGGNTTGQANVGPNDISVLSNWSLGVLPVNGDDVIVNTSNQAMLYSLNALSAVALNSLTIYSTYTQFIGLPEINANGYAEYRPTYLNVGTTTFTIGQGGGPGSGRIKLNTGSGGTSGTVFLTAINQDVTGLEAFLWKGTGTNTIQCYGGYTGISVLAGETSTVATLDVGGSGTVRVGSGCTLTTLQQGGGNVLCNTGGTTFNITGGTATINGAFTTVNIFKGRVNRIDAGTWGTTSVWGTLDCTQNLSSRIFTTTNLYAGCTFTDTFKTASTQALTCFAPLSAMKVDIGVKYTITRS